MRTKRVEPLTLSVEEAIANRNPTDIEVEAKINKQKYTVDTCFICKLDNYQEFIMAYVESGEYEFILTTHVIRELHALQDAKSAKYCKDENLAVKIRVFLRWAIDNPSLIMPVDSDDFDGRNVDDSIIKFAKANNVGILTCDKEMCLIARAKGVDAIYCTADTKLIANLDEKEKKTEVANEEEKNEFEKIKFPKVTLGLARFDYTKCSLVLDMAQPNTLCELVNREVFQNKVTLMVDDEIWVCSLKKTGRVNFKVFRVCNIREEYNAFLLYNKTLTTFDINLGTFIGKIPEKYHGFIEKFKEEVLK